MKSFLREFFSTLLLAIVIYFLMQTTILSSVVVGSSMEPSFQNGQRLLINKAAYDFSLINIPIFHVGEPKRGDVVILHPPSDLNKDFIKRVIGLPGDTIEIKNGVVSVNGSPLREPYIKDAPQYTFASHVVPANSYFVLGDNRNISNDSHTGWMLPRQNLIGRAWLSIWPPDDWGAVQNYPLQEQLAKK